jgi:hypothetical protein
MQPNAGAASRYLAEQIRAHRQRHGLALNDLTALTDTGGIPVGLERLTSIESAAGSPVTLEEATTLAQALDIDLSDLVAAPVVAPRRRPTIALFTARPEEYDALAALIDDPIEYTDDRPPRAALLGRLPAEGGQHAVALVMAARADMNLTAAMATMPIRFESISYMIISGLADGLPTPLRRHGIALGDVVVAAEGVIDKTHVVALPDGELYFGAADAPQPASLFRQESRGDTNGLRQPHLFDQALNRSLAALAGDRPQPTHRPTVHLGAIAASEVNQLDGNMDKLAVTVRAIEREDSDILRAQGLTHAPPWLLVRGISRIHGQPDTPQWRPYAAAAAAAYVAALLARIRPLQPDGGKPYAAPLSFE